MSQRRVVIDGSNIATEGRALPSLVQLRDAVAAWKAENPDDHVTVVVDASFSYRIDEAERAEFEHARTTGELVSPPAGAIGRGDGFLLQIADRTDAVVLSNDSFQEYHGEYKWLFERGRLVGGTPVAGVGWIFSLRTPVRGPKSRESIKEAKKKAGRKAAPIEEAIAEATEDVMEPGGGGGRRKRRRRRGAPVGPSPEAVNDPAPFIHFITTYKLGSPVTALVERFASHGAFVTVDGVMCYVPLTAMGTPPPRSAREVMKRGEHREFVVQALDAPRRGVELALPGFERLSSQPTEETVEAEIEAEEERARRRRRAAEAPAEKAPSRKKKAAAKKAAAKKMAAAAPEPARKAGTKKAGAAKKVAAKKKAAAAPAPEPVKKAAKKQTAAKKAVATKKAAAKKAPAEKAAAAKKQVTKKAAKKTAAAAKASRKRS